VLLVTSVAEVESGDVHPGDQETLQHLLRVGGGPQGADDLGSAHVAGRLPLASRSVKASMPTLCGETSDRVRRKRPGSSPSEGSGAVSCAAGAGGSPSPRPPTPRSADRRARARGRRAGGGCGARRPAGTGRAGAASRGT